MKLETIKLWWRVNNIHKDAFKNCLSLQEFNGSYMSYFHVYAFTNCTNLREVKLNIEIISKITTHLFFGCICPMLRFSFFDDDMEALLSQLRNISLYWLRSPDVMDSMMKIVKFLLKENMPRRLITMKTRIWGCYRKRVLFRINEMCKHAMNPAHGHMSIDEEKYCADNIMVAHCNMNQVVIYLTSTIGNVHNISIKPAQNSSSDTVAMGVAANLGAKHGKKRHRNRNGDNICSLPTPIHKQTPSSYDCDVRIITVQLILSYLIIEGPTFDKFGFRKG